MNNQLTLLNANNGIKYSGLRKDLPDINNLYQTTFYSSYLKNSIKKYISDRKPILSSIMLYIITDQQASSIADIISFTENNKQIKTFLFLTPQLSHNLSINNINLKNEIISPKEKIQIEVEIENNGHLIIEHALLKLIIYRNSSLESKN